jgi:hypothetical protein
MISTRQEWLDYGLILKLEKLKPYLMNSWQQDKVELIETSLDSI